MDSLFARPEGVAVGQGYVDLAKEASGIPDPMMRVTVSEIDIAGMIVLVSGIRGLGGMRRVVTAQVLRDEYRRDE